MAALSTLHPKVLIHAYSAPTSLVNQALIESAREFCRETRYWREDLAPVSLVADTHTYTPVLPTDSEIVDFSNVHYSDVRKLTPRTDYQMDQILTDWRTEEGKPWYFQRVSTDQIRIIYIPSDAETDAINIKAVLMPTIAAATLDDKLVQEYDDAIAYGAIHRILRVPGRPWSDPNLATYYDTLFREDIDKAKTRGADERQTGVPRKVKYGGY